MRQPRPGARSTTPSGSSSTPVTLTLTLTLTLTQTQTQTRTPEPEPEPEPEAEPQPGGSPSARGGSPSRARNEEYGPYSLQASVFAMHSAFAQPPSPASHRLRLSKSSGDIAYKLSLGTSPLLAGRSPSPMPEGAALSRPPLAYGKRPKPTSKLPKLEWQPPAPQHIPQHGSIDALSVVEWSTAAAPPSKVEFALGPPVLRPSEPGPEGEAPAG